MQTLLPNVKRGKTFAWHLAFRIPSFPCQQYIAHQTHPALLGRYHIRCDENRWVFTSTDENELYEVESDGDKEEKRCSCISSHCTCPAQPVALLSLIAKTENKIIYCGEYAKEAIRPSHWSTFDYLQRIRAGSYEQRRRRTQFKCKMEKIPTRSLPCCKARSFQTITSPLFTIILGSVAMPIRITCTDFCQLGPALSVAANF